MNGLQKIQVTLLSEIDEICKANNLHYVLANEAALCAYRSKAFEGDRSTANIYMPYPDMVKLRKIILKKKNKNRFLDSLFDNPNYPDTTFRYCDENSTHYHITDNLKSCYRSHGIFVKICPLFKENANGKSAEKSTQMEQFWREEHTNLESKENWNTLHYKYFRFVMAKLLLRANENYSLSNKLVFIGLNGRKTVFPKNMFAKTMSVELYGKEFLIPKNAKRYFEILYTFNWTNKKFNGVGISDSFIIDDKMSYKDYLKHINNNGIICDSVKINNQLKELKSISNPIMKQINKAWDTARLSVETFIIKRKYFDQKQTIISLFESENWQQLEEIFEEYEKLALQFASKNQLMIFDDEIFNIFKQLQSHKGNKAFLNKLEKLQKQNN